MSSNDEAFRCDVEPELPVLLRVAHRLTGNRADAEDLVQETVLRAYRAVHRFDGRSARAWLLTILRNTWRSMNRKARPGLLDEDDDPVAVRAAGEGARSGEESLILLVDVEGLSYHEAAEFLKVPQGTIMSRLHRGRTRLRNQLERTRQHPHLREWDCEVPGFRDHMVVHDATDARKLVRAVPLTRPSV